MIVEGLMRVGQFEVQFDNPPHGLVRSALEKFDQIIVTPTDVIDDGMTRSDLVAMARYRGIIEAWDDSRTKVTGTGLAGVLGNAQGIGAGNYYLGSASQTPSQDFGDWLAQLDSDGHLNGLVAGTAYSATATAWPATSHVGDLGYSSFDIITKLAMATGNKWRVNTDRTIDYGAAVFVSSPTVLLSPSIDGHDPAIHALPVTGWNVRKSFEGYVNYVRAEGSGGVLGADNQLGSETAKDAAGTNAMRRKINISAPDAGATADADAYAAGILADRQAVETDVSVSVDVFDLATYAEPGDLLYLHDLVDYLLDTTNQIECRGEVLHPSTVRLFEARQPIRDGMGVYLLDHDTASDPQFIRVTDWVKWETGSVQLKVGARRKSAFVGA